MAHVRDTTPPLGAIIAWHKQLLPGQPTLPRGWIECNGGKIPYGPLAGQTIPNLNAEKRFLRGGSVSGKQESDQIINHSHAHSFRVGDHTHALSPHAWSEPQDRDRAGSGVQNYGAPNGAPWPDHEVITRTGGSRKEELVLTGEILQPAGRGGRQIQIGDETRPINMSVVWIMRIE